MFFCFSNNPYIAIIGDLMESKKIQARGEIQEKLKEVLNSINSIYTNDISSNFIITLGDEFQGLLCRGENVMKILSEIEDRMYPVKIRFGIGVGAITTEINRSMAIGADGPAYYKAREAMEYLREQEKRKQTVTANMRFEFEDGNQEIETMINTILGLLTVMKNSWSNRQREVISDMMKHQDSQKNAAQRLNIQQPTVQKILSKGNYYSYKDAFNTVGRALEEIKHDNI